MLNTKYFWKKLLLLTFLLISIVAISPVKGEKKDNKPQEVDKTMLDFYRHYGVYTNPGEYDSLYKNLPDSLTELCKMIKAQLIHPDADLPLYRDLIPPERNREDEKYPTVKSILGGLMAYNSAGLINERKPEQRLILSCRYHAILLASILKYRGIPVRVRYGFAHYLYPGYHIYHVICEVWNDREHRWMLVDPDRQMVDFSREQFEFAGDVWLRYKQKKLDPYTYGVPEWWGAHPILSVLCHDLAAVLGNEYVYWNQPPICHDPEMNVKSTPSDQVEILNKFAALLQNPDNELQELQLIYDKYKYLQFCK